MKDFAAGPPDQVVRGDALRTTAALGAEPPGGGRGAAIIIVTKTDLTGTKRATISERDGNTGTVR